MKIQLIFISAGPCPKLTDGSGTVAVPSTIFNVSYVYNYTCLPGFFTTNELTSICLPGGIWSLDPPTCTGNSTAMIIVDKINKW